MLAAREGPGPSSGLNDFLTFWVLIQIAIRTIVATESQMSSGWPAFVHPFGALPPARRAKVHGGLERRTEQWIFVRSEVPDTRARDRALPNCS